MKTAMWKKGILILAVLLFAAACAYWVDRAAYEQFSSYDIETNVNTVFTDSSDVIGMSGCEVSGGSVTVTGYDPQFVVNAHNRKISRIHILFDSPVNQNTFLQIFYAPTGNGFSEENSVRRTIAAGSKEEFFQIPEATYKALRFDFEQDVKIDKIIAGKEEWIVLENKPHAVRMIAVFSIIFIPLCVLIVVKRGKENNSKKDLKKPLK